MAVVINEFEVVPQSPQNEGQAAKKEDKKGGGSNEPPTDHEVKRMLERRMERLERVSAH
jgi:hypothetical protein